MSITPGPSGRGKSGRAVIEDRLCYDIEELTGDVEYIEKEGDDTALIRYITKKLLDQS